MSRLTRSATIGNTGSSGESFERSSADLNSSMRGHLHEKPAEVAGRVDGKRVELGMLPGVLLREGPCGLSNKILRKAQFTGCC